MKNNRIKQITIISVLLVIAIALVYGIYQKSQPIIQPDVGVNNEESKKVKVEDIEEKSTIKVPDIKVIEQNNDNEMEEEKETDEVDNIKDKDIEEVTVEVDKPVVPPKPELPKEEPVDELLNQRLNLYLVMKMQLKMVMRKKILTHQHMMNYQQ